MIPRQFRNLFESVKLARIRFPQMVSFWWCHWGGRLVGVCDLPAVRVEGEQVGVEHASVLCNTARATCLVFTMKFCSVCTFLAYVWQHASMLHMSYGIVWACCMCCLAVYEGPMLCVSAGSLWACCVCVTILWQCVCFSGSVWRCCACHCRVCVSMLCVMVLCEHVQIIVAVCEHVFFPDGSMLRMPLSYDCVWAFCMLLIVCCARHFYSSVRACSLLLMAVCVVRVTVWWQRVSMLCMWLSFNSVLACCVCPTEESRF